MAHTPEAVSALERDLREIFGTRLRSIVLYGLHETDTHEDTDRAVSHAHDAALTHTLIIVETLTGEDLKACAPRVPTWHAAGLATPLLLAGHEFDRSLDAFPYEFGAILADHVVWQGPNPFDALAVSPADLRRACEVQARSHLLHLREGYLETHGSENGLAVLTVRSAGPFAALVKSVARLQGEATHDASAAGRHAERALNLPGGVLTDVVKLAGVKEIAAAEAVRIFPAYLDAVERLVRHVDTWGAA